MANTIKTPYRDRPVISINEKTAIVDSIASPSNKFDPGTAADIMAKCLNKIEQDLEERNRFLSDLSKRVTKDMDRVTELEHKQRITDATISEINGCLNQLFKHRCSK